ncbi:MAG TPA: hypothetical protein VHB48_10945 [Chitinophagaceae bacterium]|jgi:hypothetical protein|nr:hypothetical protein [Chitinophagaceae bacterium]
MEVLVFKTNVENNKQVSTLLPVLKTLQGILRWNVDLQDIDKVLRIEAISLSPRMIESALQQAGYFCKELE